MGRLARWSGPYSCSRAGRCTPTTTNVPRDVEHDGANRQHGALEVIADAVANAERQQAKAVATHELHADAKVSHKLGPNRGGHGYETLEHKHHVQAVRCTLAGALQNPIIAHSPQLGLVRRVREASKLHHERAAAVVVQTRPGTTRTWHKT